MEWYAGVIIVLSCSLCAAIVLIYTLLKMMIKLSDERHYAVMRNIDLTLANNRLHSELRKGSGTKSNDRLTCYNNQGREYLTLLKTYIAVDYCNDKTVLIKNDDGELAWYPLFLFERIER